MHSNKKPIEKTSPPLRLVGGTTFKEQARTPDNTMGTHTIMKTAGDLTAVAIAGATLLEWLPPLAAAFTIVWVGIQIYSWTHTSDTPFAKWLGKVTGRK